MENAFKIRAEGSRFPPSSSRPCHSDPLVESVEETIVLRDRNGASNVESEGCNDRISEAKDDDAAAADVNSSRTHAANQISSHSDHALQAGMLHRRQQHHHQQQQQQKRSRRKSSHVAYYPHDMECLQRVFRDVQEGKGEDAAGKRVHCTGNFNPDPDPHAAHADAAGGEHHETHDDEDDDHGSLFFSSSYRKKAIRHSLLQSIVPPPPAPRLRPSVILSSGSLYSDKPVASAPFWAPNVHNTPEESSTAVSTVTETVQTSNTFAICSDERDRRRTNRHSFVVDDADVQMLRICLERGDSEGGAPLLPMSDRSNLRYAVQQQLKKALADLCSEQRAVLSESEGPCCDPPRQHDSTHRSSIPTPIFVITGAEGSGKTRLVRSLFQHPGDGNCDGGSATIGESSATSSSSALPFLLLTGRSRPNLGPDSSLSSLASQPRELVPYAALQSVVEDWCGHVQRSGPQAVLYWRRVLHDSLNLGAGAEGGKGLDGSSALLSAIPGLASILMDEGRASELTSATTPTTPKSPLNYPEERFSFMLRTLIQTIILYSGADQQHRLVLFLDDAHNLDRPSLELLASSLSAIDDDNRPVRTEKGILAVVMTLRNDDPILIESSECWRLLREWSSSLEPSSSTLPVALVASHVTVRWFDLPAMDASQVDRWLSRSLKMDAIEQSSRLNSLIYSFSGGNPGLVVEACCYLQETGLLSWDQASSQWNWLVDDIEESLSFGIRKAANNERHMILTKRLCLLPVHITNALQVASCLGPRVNEDLIESVVSVPVAQSLQAAASRGYLQEVCRVPGGTKKHGHYVFASDRSQRACYHLILSEQRERFHLNLGRAIWVSLQDEAAIERNLFIILSQLVLCMRVLELEQHSNKVAVASLCLHGGTRAAMSSNFRLASTYLGVGIQLVGDHGWTNNYDLTLVLHNAAAEMAMCTSDHVALNKHIDQVLRKARSVSDKLTVYSTRIHSLCLCGKYQQALEAGISTLHSLGESFPTSVTPSRLIYLFQRVRRTLKSKSNEQILRIPDMDDKMKLASITIYHLLGTALVNIRPELTPYAALKMISLTIKHGLSPFSSFAFAMVGTLCQTLHGDIESGLRYGQLALRLYQRYGRKEFMPRVYSLYFGLTHVWKRPVQEVLRPLRQGFEVGLRTGDIEGALMCGRIYCMTSVEVGLSLHVALRDFQRLESVIRNSQHAGMLPSILSEIQALHHLVGYSKDPLSTKGDVIDIDATLSEAERSGQYMSVHAIKMTRMKVCYVFNDYEQAAKLMVTSFKKVPPVFSHCVALMTVGLVALANAKGNRAWLRFRYLCTARRVIRKLRRLSLQCPENVLDKLSLVQAERLSVLGGRDAEAYERYLCALSAAERAKFPFMVGLISERTARHLQDLEIMDVAGDPSKVVLPASSASLAFFEQAVKSFEEIGAAAKASQLRGEIHSRYTVLLSRSFAQCRVTTTDGL